MIGIIAQLEPITYDSDNHPQFLTTHLAAMGMNKWSPLPLFILSIQQSHGLSSFSFKSCRSWPETTPDIRPCRISGLRNYSPRQIIPMRIPVPICLW